MQSHFRGAGFGDRDDLGTQPVGAQEIVGDGEPSAIIRHQQMITGGTPELGHYQASRVRSSLVGVFIASFRARRLPFRSRRSRSVRYLSYLRSLLDVRQSDKVLEVGFEHDAFHSSECGRSYSTRKLTTPVPVEGGVAGAAARHAQDQGRRHRQGPRQPQGQGPDRSARPPRGDNPVPLRNTRAGLEAVGVETEDAAPEGATPRDRGATSKPAHFVLRVGGVAAVHGE